MRRLINKIKYSVEDFFEDAKKHGVNKFFASLVVLLIVILFLCVVVCAIGFIGAIYCLTRSVIITSIAILILICIILFPK